jgi:hypothetical protein
MPDHRRPTSITLLSFAIVGLALWNGLRLIQAIAFWSILKEFHSNPGPLYLACSGGAWFLAGSSIALGLWKGKEWAWFMALGGAFLYTCWYWCDRLALQEPHSNWPFALVFNGLILLSFGLLFRHNVIRYFFPKSPPSFPLIPSRRIGMKSKQQEKDK